MSKQDRRAHLGKLRLLCARVAPLDPASGAYRAPENPRQGGRACPLDPSLKGDCAPENLQQGECLPLDPTEEGATAPPTPAGGAL